MVYTNQFDENSDLSTTFLWQSKMTRDSKFKAEENFPITGQDFTTGNLLDGTGCQTLLVQVILNHLCQNPLYEK